MRPPTRNPALPRTGYTPGTRAKLTPGHFQAADVRAAQQAVAAVLDGRGKLLGHGNFGVTYVVSLDGTKSTKVIVKLATRETMHSRESTEIRAYRAKAGHPTPSYARPRSTSSAKEEILHEAGIANFLWSAGFRCVPGTVYAQYKGVNALVREYGEIVAGSDATEGPVGEPVGLTSLREYDALAACLVPVIDVQNIAVADDLLVARRTVASADGTAPRGSLYIADVGFWRVLEGKRKPGGFHDPWENAFRDLWRLLRAIAPGTVRAGHHGVAREGGVASKAEIAWMQQELASREASLDAAVREGGKHSGARMYANQVNDQRRRIDAAIEARAAYRNP